MSARSRFAIALIVVVAVTGVTWANLAKEAEAKNYRGPFQGRVVDAETRAPIEGAVVFVEWHIRHMGAGDTFYDATEVLTDANGAFSISSKWSWNPWTNVVMDSSFTIFKAGYGHVHAHWTTLHESAKFLAQLPPEKRIGTPSLYYNIDFEDDVPIFLVKKLDTTRERALNLPDSSSAPPNQKQLLMREINAERAALGADAVTD